MKNINKAKGFEVLDTQEAVQTAAMILAPGESSGPKMNEHPSSEQVLFVMAGEVDAEIGDRRFHMTAGDSTIVPKRVAHRFTNAGKETAITFNVYTPPAY
jgi:mannose-6-phosphate isomerase-like protein (cupin superfamily)